MAVHVQTGNMLDVVVEQKSIGLKQRDSDHRKYEVIWLPKPEGLRDALTAEINRLNPAPTPSEAAQQAARDIVAAFYVALARDAEKEIAEIISRYCGTGEMK